MLVCNGEMLSTVGDMYKWHLALTSGSVLSREALVKYQTPYIREGPSAPTFYAYGWSIANSPHGKLVEHNGGNGIFHADFLRYVEAGQVVYIASNVTEINGIEISHKLAAAAFGDSYDLPPKAMPEDLSKSEKYSGTYVLSSGSTLVVRGTSVGLELVPHDPAAFQILMQRKTGGGSRNSDDEAKLNALSERTSKIIEQSARGDYKELVTSLHGEAPASEIESRAKESWSQLEKRWGKFKNTVVFGAVPSHEALIATFARIDFEKGSVYIRYSWEDGWLQDIRIMETIPARRFLSESPDNFVAFRVADEPLRIRFRRDNPQGVSSLVIHTENGDVLASKR
jgi:hypothetical protein